MLGAAVRSSAASQPGKSAVTVFAGFGLQGIVDQKSRDPESLARSFAESLKAIHNVKLAPACDALLVVCPEHERTFREAGWSKARLYEELYRLCEIPGEDLVAGAKGIAEGGPPSLAGKTVNKFRPGGLMIVRAGGGAGMFSGIIGGWSAGGGGSPAAALVPITREVQATIGGDMTVLLDPTSERSPTIRPRLPRPERLDGLTVGILDIAKARGDVFLKRLGERLGERGIAFKHYAKPTNTRAGAAAAAAADRHRGRPRHRGAERLRVLHIVLYA